MIDETRKPDHEAEDQDTTASSPESDQKPVEIGGREGPEPTRFGDWEKDGRCIDF